MYRVMFVDDEKAVLDGLRRGLRGQTPVWDMQFVDSPTRALALMGDSPVDAVVADFKMPGMNGGQLLGEVRERWPDTSRLMLSGHTDEDDLLGVVSVAHRFLDKPCPRATLISAIEQTLLLRSTLDGETVRGEIAGIGLLPAGASTMHRLRACLNDPRPDLAEVAIIVEGDVGLTVNVLQLANSALFPGGGQVTSIPGALQMLGLTAIGSLALLRGLLEPSTRPNVAGSWLDDLNAHAALTARLAAKFARPEEAADAFCAALVQESGQLVLASCRPASFQRILSTSHDSAETRRAIELAEFGVTHAQAGAYLLGLWGFPATIVELVAHHDLQPSGQTGLGTQSAADAIRTARAIAHRHLAPICPVEKDHAIHPDDAVNEIAHEVLRDAWLPYETAA